MKILLAFFLTTPAFSQTEYVPESFVWACQLKNSFRSIKVDHSPSRCSTIYSKNGQDQLMSRTTDRGACEAVAENIRGNLEKANWKCKALDNSSFKTTSEAQ